MTKKTQKILSLYPENEKQYQAVRAVKGVEGFKLIGGEKVDKSDLEKYLKQDNADLTIGVMPSRRSFHRVVSLPPIELKRIPEIAKFEALQQIPFDIHDVYWTWQLIDKKDSSKGLRLSAIKKEEVDSMFPFKKMDMVSCLGDTLPFLYAKGPNAYSFLNIEEAHTGIFVCKDKKLLWDRTISFGTNEFAEEGAKDDLISEIERSYGFYKNREENPKITDYFLTTPDNYDLATKLKSKLGVDYVTIDFANNFAPNNRREISPEYFAAVSGILSLEDPMNLKIKKKRLGGSLISVPVGGLLKGLGGLIGDLGRSIEDTGKNISKGK